MRARRRSRPEPPVGGGRQPQRNAAARRSTPRDAADDSAGRKLPTRHRGANRRLRRTRRLTRREGDSNQSGPLRVPGQAILRPLRHPHLAGRGGRHGGRGRRAGRRRGLSRGGQGAGQGRWPRQGGRRQAGRRRRRGASARRQHPRPRHQGPRRQAALGRARVGHRQGVLRQLHPRPPGEAASRHAVGRGRGRDRGGGRDQPRRHRQDPRRPRRRAERGGGPRVGRPGRTSTPRHATRRPPCWCASTTATSRATATWPRSTR